mgnify:FL=1
MKQLVYTFLALFFALIMASCNRTTTETHSVEVPEGTHKVVVKEVQQTTVYTYLYVEENGKEYWLAINKQEAKPGDTYYFESSYEMNNFESKELKRTFESLLLVDNIRTTPETATAMPPHGMGMKSSGSVTPVDYEIEVINHEAGELPIGDLYKDPSAFEGKKVKVRGKVVKYNGEIMDRNWIHIQDGTSANNKFDLTITSLDQVNVGEIAAFEGVITLNKDFGAGYKYEVIMEEAKLLAK